MPRDKVLIRSMKLQNLLSFGPTLPVIELENLNVLIGPNGSGKSNFLSAIALIRSSATDMQRIIREGGGYSEWIWHGSSGESVLLEVELGLDGSQFSNGLVHKILLDSHTNGYYIAVEAIAGPGEGPPENRENIFYFSVNSQPRIKSSGGEFVEINQDAFSPHQSILSQRYDPESYSELAHLANRYKSSKLYRDWTLGPKTVFREPQRADMRPWPLEDDFSNMSLYLSRLSRKPGTKALLLDSLRDLYQEFSDFSVDVVNGMVQIYFTEGDYSIPATRLSDGTLRYLCLLAILLDPDPPPLICIEEPELGLHPDIIPKLADHLIDASQRTQLIVTTHSDILVDALSKLPESIIVCEKVDGQTQMRRLKSTDLEVWLKDYGLGELWTRGHLGGNRW